ncbi:MAG: permease prefix domain 1-containing protein [Patescibacteria group bacterium]
MRRPSNVRQELESHIADQADELVEQGIDREEALRQARLAFGDIKKCEQEVLAFNATRLLFTPMILAAVGAAVAICLSLGSWLRQYPLTGVLLQPVLLGAVYLGLFTLVTRALTWLLEYWSITSRTALWASLVFGVAVNMSLTLVNDLDDFLVPLHALALALLLLAVLQRHWRALPIFYKKIFIYGFSITATWSAIHGKAVFAFLYTQPCLYLTRDTTPLTGALAACQQVPLAHPVLWPLYALGLVALVAGVRFLGRYWKNTGSYRSRKVALSVIFAALPLLPLAVHDVNNYGKVDVISWKPAIFQAYQDILGRNPQSKDITFYARTRAYTQLPRVREVLYQSVERTLVIEKIHQKILGRSASTAEINFFFEGRQTVEEIRTTLRQD